jgi:hypothetical protein
MFDIDAVKKEFLLHNEAGTSGTKSLKMRVDHTTRVVSYVVEKSGTPVQLFTNLVAAVKRYNG